MTRIESTPPPADSPRPNPQPPPTTSAAGDLGRSRASGEPGAILVDRELRALLGTGILGRQGGLPLAPQNVQPASLDLRLGPVAHRIRAGFLPGRVPVQRRLEELTTSTLNLTGEGAILERGLIYLVPLEEALALPPDVHGRFNPRSSTGRCDLFTRVLVEGHPRFDETPAGWAGRLWLEIAPLSFPVRLRQGDRLAQLRLQRGVAALTTEELRATYRRTPLCFERSGETAHERPLGLDEVRFDEDGALELRLGLAGRDPAGWRAQLHTDVVEFAREGVHDTLDYWEPMHARRGRCILDPGRFSILASKERIRIPPHLAAEMLPIDAGLGELRNNYAGFFDNGFGWRGSQRGTASDSTDAGGTPAVLEVRAHDVPFVIEDGQVFFRLRFFRTNGTPDQLYGEGRGGASYARQDLTLARPFRPIG